LAAGVPHDLMAGTPHASTVSVNNANGIQARATRPGASVSWT